jgi:hypothetical protein
MDDGWSMDGRWMRRLGMGRMTDELKEEVGGAEFGEAEEVFAKHLEFEPTFADEFAFHYSKELTAGAFGQFKFWESFG